MSIYVDSDIDILYFKSSLQVPNVYFLPYSQAKNCALETGPFCNAK